MARVFTFLSFIVFFLVILIIGGGVFLHIWSSTSVDTGSEVVEFDLEKGMSLPLVAESLQSKSLVSSADKFILWVKIFSNFKNFQAGHYAFSRFVSPKEIEQSFVSGKIYSVPKLEVIIPEGFTLDQIIARFVSLGVGSTDEFLRVGHDPEFLASQGISAASIEGYLYPAKYSFYSMPSVKDVYVEMIKVFWKRLPPNYEILVASRGITLHQAMIIASLVEAETSKDFERPMVAEVVWNRLERKMPLGIDAAVIYGIPSFNGNLTKRDLEDASNPYNLRIHVGLPPTPINTPSKESLLSVVNPTNFGYLYYVLNPDRDKEHTFSKTLEEHNKAVKRLVSSR